MFTRFCDSAPGSKASNVGLMNDALWCNHHIFLLSRFILNLKTREWWIGIINCVEKHEKLSFGWCCSIDKPCTIACRITACVSLEPSFDCLLFFLLKNILIMKYGKVMQKSLWCINLCSSGEKLEQEVPEWSNNISERGEHFILTGPRFAVDAPCQPDINDYCCAKDRDQYAIYHLNTTDV